MKACTLSPAGRAAQADLFREVRSSVEAIDRAPTSLTVRFGRGVDERSLRELVATERECCSFLDIEYSDRVLRVASDDPVEIDPFEELLR